MTSDGSRGPQREAMSSFSPKMSWPFTAGMPAQPGRLATMAGVCPPSAGWLSARKMSFGLAATMYSSDSSG